MCTSQYLPTRFRGRLCIQVAVENGVELPLGPGAAHQCAGGDSSADGVPPSLERSIKRQQADHECGGLFGHLLRPDEGAVG